MRDSALCDRMNDQVRASVVPAYICMDAGHFRWVIQVAGAGRLHRPAFVG